MSQTSPALPLAERMAGPWAWRIVAGLIAVYALAFALFYPRTVTVIDEMSYVRQAQRIATGVDHVTLSHPLTGAPVDYEIKTVYPVGTALVLTPWIAAGGWQWAFVAPALCLLLGVALTARWIAREGRSPLAAALLLGFPPALVLGRVGMSEAPSLFWVSLGLLLFWRGLDGPRRTSWLAAGFLAGGSLLFRESNVLLFAPLLLGTVVRRDRAWWALLAGGLLGVAARGVSGQLFWGDPFHYKSPGYAFGPDAIAANVPLYAFALLVLVPGGLLCGLLYRGRRWPEIVATVAVFVGFYHLYDYSGESSGLAKQLILGPRFFVPLLPILAFAAAEVVPRLGQAVCRRWPSRAPLARRLAGIALVAWVAGLAAASVGAHAVHASWSAAQAAMREAIYSHTPEGSIIVSNARALSKIVNPIYGERFHLNRDGISTRLAAALVERNGAFYLVLLDRSDSELWRRDARENQAYLTSFFPRPELLLDLEVTDTDRLRIWRVSRIEGGL